MAKAATIGSPASASLQNGVGGVGGERKAGPMARRKTPSELRGEQLKKANNAELVDALTKNTNDADSGLKNYIDTRINDVYPVKKLRFKMHSSTENAKENIVSELSTNRTNLSTVSNLAAMRLQLSRMKKPVACDQVPKDGMMQSCPAFEKCSQSLFRTVTDLSSAGERSSGLAAVDMDKALKGLVAHESSTNSGLYLSENVGSDKSHYPANFCHEFLIPGPKAPFDFTLKTKMQVACTSSVNWIHRSIMSSTYNGMPQLTSQLGCSVDGRSSAELVASQIVGSKALHSWVYPNPQYALPPSVISLLTSSASVEGVTDFLSKRQLAWDDSFRNLYYMLRKNICNIFYVCTLHFVVMFKANGGTKSPCSAYISRSTRGLRSLLREHDVGFSMPLCHTKVEQVNAEDLVELSEIEKQNLGQTRRLGSLSNVDNSPQSLLAFHGNYNVHGLYDFLLNYRSFLTSLLGVDVPRLYSPVPFQNAAISAPEIKCVERKTADHGASPTRGSTVKDGDSEQDSSTILCSSIEIKDEYIPPWIITRVCALMGSDGRSFQARFTTEHTSIGLNVSLGTVHEKSVSAAGTGEGLQEGSYSDVCGVEEAIHAPQLSSGFLKGLKYSNGSYTASLSPV